MDVDLDPSKRNRRREQQRRYRRKYDSRPHVKLARKMRKAGFSRERIRIEVEKLKNEMSS